MKIKEIFLDRLIETSLFEMALSRKDAKNTVTSVSPLIFDHLLKLWVIDSPENATHWYVEIDKQLRAIDKIYLKPSTKKIDQDTLYTWLIYDSAPHYGADYIGNTVRQWKQNDYKSMTFREFDIDTVLNQILTIIAKVCHDISSNSFNSIQDYLK